MTQQSAALELLAALVLEDGRRWGEAAVPDQWEDAEVVLSGDVPYHFLTRARGYSKTTDLGGIAIAVMLAQLDAGTRLYGLAADQDQGRLLIDSIDGFRARTPEIAGALSVNAYRAVAASGSTLDVLPADDAGAWGLRPAFLVVDELAQWATTRKPRAMWDAVTSAMAKVPGSRMVVLTSSGDPVNWSHGILEHALADALWRVHEVHGAPPWADPARLEEQRRRLPASQFARLFLNEWTASEDRLTSLDDLRACVTLDGPLPPQSGVSYVCGLDLGLKNDRTVAAICHSEPVRTSDGSTVGTRVPLDRMQVWKGTAKRPVQLSEVEDWLLESAQFYRPLRVVFDPYQAVGLAQRLRQHGVAMEEFTFSQSSVGKLASTLHVAIREHQVALPDDPELLEELANVRLREVSTGVMRMDHDSDKHDDRAIALALAVEKLMTTNPPQGAAFLAYWKKDLAKRGTPETTAAARTTAEPTPLERRRRNEDRQARRLERQQARCSHYWLPPVGDTPRVCMHCGASHALVPA